MDARDMRPGWAIRVWRLGLGIAMLGAAFAATANPVAELQPYQPQMQVTGVLRIYGSPLAGQVEAWTSGFKKFHPQVEFQNSYPSSDAATAGLIAGGADIGSSGREPLLSDYLAFNEVMKYDLVEVAVATGTFSVSGATPSVVIYVHPENPIAGLTIDQLDGIFGDERAGGYEGYIWQTKYGRSRTGNIRTWGQLGLRGEWRRRPIRTHGYASTGMSNFFQRVVFKGGDKWNPNYRQYVESFTKMTANGDYGDGSSQYMLQQIANDKYAIAWSFVTQEQRMRVGKVRAVPIARTAAGPYILPSRDSIADRTYPLTRSIFLYVKKSPTGVDPRVQEFLRYVMSREGQADVQRVGIYLPLTAQTAREQLERVR